MNIIVRVIVSLSMWSASPELRRSRTAVGNYSLRSSVYQMVGFRRLAGEMNPSGETQPGASTSTAPQPGPKDSRAQASSMLRVAIGLAILGGTSYVFLSVAARRLSAEDFASISVLWSVIYIVGPGVFQPFEQHIGRALAARRARGERGTGAQRRVVVIAVVIVLGLCTATLALVRPLAQALFGGSVPVAVALVFSFVALAAAYLYRGVLAGVGRFDLYGAQLAVEGVARLIGCLLIWWLLKSGVGSFAVLIPLAQAVAVVATVRPGRVLFHAGRRNSVGELVTGSGRGVSTRPGRVEVGIIWLIGAALLSQALVNASTLLARLLDRNAAGLVDHLQAGLLIARVPLLLFAAVPAALLPRLAAMAAAGQFAAMRRRTGAVVAGVALVMAAATVTARIVGPRVVRLMFGSSFDMSSSMVAGLTGGTGLFMMAGVAASAVVAAGRFGLATLGWGSGVAALVAALLLPASPSTRIVAGFVLGTAISFVMLSILAWRSMSGPGIAEADRSAGATNGPVRTDGTRPEWCGELS